MKIQDCSESGPKATSLSERMGGQVPLAMIALDPQAKFDHRVHSVIFAAYCYESH